MPLPDAPNTSPRVYTLLQNTDLENVTQANLATLGNPISVEELNEDELRRLVLVNLARLSVKSEWNGLLTAASGGGSSFPPSINPETLGIYQGLQSELTGGSVPGTFDMAASTFYDHSFYYPFTASFTDEVKELKFEVTTAGSAGTQLSVGIYTMTNGLPDSRIGYATTAVDSTGVKTITSFSSTVNVTAGTQYYVGFCRDTTSDQVVLRATGLVALSATIGYIPTATTSQLSLNILSNGEDDLDLPATVTAGTNLTGLARNVPVFMIKGDW